MRLINIAPQCQIKFNYYIQLEFHCSNRQWFKIDITHTIWNESKIKCIRFKNHENVFAHNSKLQLLNPIQ